MEDLNPLDQRSSEPIPYDIELCTIPLDVEMSVPTTTSLSFKTWFQGLFTKHVDPICNVDGIDFNEDSPSVDDARCFRVVRTFYKRLKGCCKYRT